MTRHVLGIPVESIIGPIAAQLAHMDDHAQIVFFQTFAKELRSACGGTQYQTQMQCAAIAMGLSEAEKDVFATIGFTAT